jgi:hypothetical protein
MDTSNFLSVFDAQHALAASRTVWRTPPVLPFLPLLPLLPFLPVLPCPSRPLPFPPLSILNRPLTLPDPPR